VGILAVVVVGAALAVPVSRRWLLGTMAAIVDVARRPRCLASLVIGCAGVTLAQLLTLQGAVNAVGGHVPWAELLAALMGSAAARSAVPSPGGVGPVEAALVGGLSALGLGLGTAAAAVAVYRTAGHWLPVLGGVLSMRSLRRAELV
jgi:glycosyltransferase 2 family protein